MRTAALTSNDREYALEMAHLIAVVGMKRHHSIREQSSEENEERCTKFMRSLMLSFCQSMVIDVRFSKIQHYNRGFDDFSDSWILNNTRFRNKHDCRLAFLSLKLPAEGFILSNRARVSSEEAWLVTLYRVTFPRRLVDVVDVFGHETTFWSRAITHTLKYILLNWYYLIGDNIPFWAPSFPLFNAKINLKIKSLGFQYDEVLIGLDHSGRHQLTFIIDCIIIRICNFMAGALTRGINARRKSALLQRAFYTGWKKMSGLKCQTVNLPNGMHLDVYGPLACRRSDSRLRRMSKIEEKLANVQLDIQHKYTAFGDSAYQRSEFMYTMNSGRNLTNRQIQENACLCAVREPIEWGNKEIKNYFKSLNYSNGLRLGSMPVCEMILFSFLMTNVLCCLYGNQTSEYFHCLPPTLERYLSQGPRHYDWRERCNYEDDIVIEEYILL